MFTTKTFIKKNKIGNFIKNVREHYLRDDLYCGFAECKKCAPATSFLTSSGNKYKNKSFNYKHYLILDTNIVLDQIDLLEEDILVNVIILHTVLREVKHRSLPIYKRLMAILENPTRKFYVFTNDHHKDTYINQEETELVNDYNDRCIRKACMWYMLHLKDKKFILLTEDVANKQIAKELKICVSNVKDYVTNLDCDVNILDKLSKKDFSDVVDAQDFYPPHLTLKDIHVGIKTGKLSQGSFRASRDNFLEGSINLENYDDPILLQGRVGLNRAVDGDIVAVEILPEDQWLSPSEVILEDESTDVGVKEVIEKENQLLSGTVSKEARKPTGKIVGIIKRKWRQYCGILQVGSNNLYHLFVPADRRIPKVRIETRQSEFLKTQKIIVAIDSWPRHSRYPNGHFVRALGTIGEQSTENEVALLEHDVPHSQFSEEVLSFLPKLPWIITEEDYKARTDLREYPICSVDPPGCTDIDDALHCRPIGGDKLEIGVHIADVSHFIRPKNALDLEAASRATTVYLVGKRIDMVPELLSSNLCSLREHVERFAFSCIWEMDANANILSTKFHKSVIKSKKAMTYEEAQLLIDDKGRSDVLTESLRSLNGMAKILKKRRLENGALVLASPEVKIMMDSETHDPIDVEVKKLYETNSMVEEFMLLANISVAEKILKEFPECAMLRRHPCPPPTNFSSLLTAGKHLGFTINIESNKSLALSLDAAERTDNPYLNTMLRILATRCMQQAVYFASGMMLKEDYQHYGLAVPLYTHFTSPIRRYADIIVHRLLAVAIGADTTYPELLSKHATENVCQNLNYRNRMAQYAGRASITFNINLFFKGKLQEEEGYILFVRKNALQILIPKYGLECTLYLSKKGEKSMFEYNEENQTQKCGDVIFHSFDPVVVRLSLDTNNIQHEKFALQLVKPNIPNFSVPSMNSGSQEKESVSAQNEGKLKKSPRKKTKKGK